MALDEDEYSSCVIDCLDFEDQITATESAGIGEDVSEEAAGTIEIIQVQPSLSDNSANHTVVGRTPRPRDQSLYLFYD